MSARSNTNQNNPQSDSTVCPVVTNRLLKTSPSGSKQGPLKATLPMSSLLKQSSNWQCGTSPVSSPKHTFDPSGLRSPGSAANKGKLVNVSFPSNIRRTASLDAINVNECWPKDAIFIHKTLQVDKSTQTDDESDERAFSTNDLFFISSQSHEIDSLRPKQRFQRCSSRSQNRSPGAGDQNTTSSQTILPRAMPVNIPNKPMSSKINIRNSVEGLNQEIERLVLKSSSSSSLHCEKFENSEKILQQVTPEGHRAPFPEHYRNTRSVNTQTPSTLDVGESCNSSSSPSRESTSPMIARQLDSFSDAGENSSPEHGASKMGTSPRLFLVRSPPDGCERVNLRLSSHLADDSSRMTDSVAPFGVACSTFKLRPSQGSAFKILQPNSSCGTSKSSPPSS